MCARLGRLAFESFQPDPARMISLPLLIGEANPYSFHADDALLPWPRTASGWRLCDKILGLTEAEYLERFDRMDLCGRRWSAPKARARAAAVLAQRAGTLILLGVKVCTAFGFRFAPFTVATAVPGRTIVILPHPSARCRLWLEAGAIQRARETLRSVCALPSGAIHVDTTARTLESLADGDATRILGEHMLTSGDLPEACTCDVDAEGNRHQDARRQGATFDELVRAQRERMARLNKVR